MLSAKSQISAPLSALLTYVESSDLEEALLLDIAPSEESKGIVLLDGSENYNRKALSFGSKLPRKPSKFKAGSHQRISISTNISIT